MVNARHKSVPISAAADDESDLVMPMVWLGFAMMCIGMFIAVLDVQVVATSLPTIQKALNIAPDEMSWIQTAYLIAEIISIPLTGFLTRLLTIRVLFVTATSLFTLASIGCALSESFALLIGFRVVQGFFGGTLIPLVFAAVFLLFPPRLHTAATVIAGMLAVLAPTLGPVVGGWITATYSWPWLFLINVVPGVLAASVARSSLPKSAPSLDEARALDVLSLAAGATALAALEIAIKEAPKRGLTSALVVTLLIVCVATAGAFVYRTLRTRRPLVDLRMFGDRNFSIGCLLSFVLGTGLFGSVYLMPIFLAYVRDHDALQIGKIMLVTGVAQLVAVPVAASLVRRLDVRILSGFGFLLFSVGLSLSAVQTRSTDFDDMFWPQIARGCAIMFCILPPTQLALGHFPKQIIADASGLFNMMRNLGGAIGIAVIDTIIFTRAPDYAHKLVERLTAGDTGAAETLGVAPDALEASLLDPDKQAALASLINKVAFVDAINDAWMFVAAITLAGLLALLWAQKQQDQPIAF